METLTDWMRERRIRTLVKRLRVEMEADPRVAAHVEDILQARQPWPQPSPKNAVEPWLRGLYFPAMLVALVHVFSATNPWSFIEVQAERQRTCDVGLCSTPQAHAFIGDVPRAR